MNLFFLEKAHFRIVIIIAVLFNVELGATNSINNGINYYIENSLPSKNELVGASQNSSNESFHLFTHGMPGKLLIENEWKDASQIVNWLEDNYDLCSFSQLNIYGCEFAKGKKGRKAISFINNSLKIMVAASDDITGIDGDWELEIGPNLSTAILRVSYFYNLQCANSPEGTAYALSASCTNGTANDDGFLQISAATNATHYNFILGNDYSLGDADIANATALDINILPLKFGVLDNPSVSADYTVRLFNGANDCFTDITVILVEQDCTSTCNCNEYIYLNDNENSAVHKFSVEGGGTLNEIGTPWYSGINKPHGLGSDLNGFLYIAEVANNFESFDIHQFDCDGNIRNTDIFSGSSDEVDFPTQIQSLNNQLIIKEYREIRIFDICDGIQIGCSDNGISKNKNWGQFVEPDGTIWLAGISHTGDNKIFTGNIADFDTDCTTKNVTEFSFELPSVEINNFAFRFFGIFVDANQFVYVVANEDQNGTGTAPTFIIKFNPDGTVNAESQVDLNGNDNGWWGTRGLVVDEAGIIYVGSNDNLTCIQSFTDNGSGLLIPGPTYDYPSPEEAGESKGIAIKKECCVAPNRQSIDQVYCVAGTNEQLFLNDLFPCDGIVCEGQWVPSDAAAEAVYNDCEQSISGGIAAGCYSFSKGSNGLEDFPKCGAFELNFNLEILKEPEITMSDDQIICSGNTPNELNVTTTAVAIQWQVSTSSCTEGFANIDGANSETYSPNVLTATSYYRIIATEIAGCSDGECSFESDCITVSVSGVAPTIDIDDAACDANLTTYTIDFTSDGTVTSDVGTVSGNQVTGIPVGTDANLTATSADDCVTTEAVTAPVCACPTVNAPVSDGDQTICADETIADFGVTTDAGLEVDWYDAATGGTLLQANSLVYTPTAAGMYYAEARDPANDCVSATRTVLTLTINTSPSLTVDGAACDANLTTYTIDFTSDGTVTSDVGTVSGNQVTGILVGTDANLTATSAEDCVTTAAVTAPECNCPTVNAPVSDGDQTICADETIVDFSVTADAGLEVDWYDAATGGTLLQANSLVYTPTAAGMYYAEARDPANDCVSATRTELTLTINASPSLTIDGAACDANLTTYTIDFTSDGTVTSDVGTVSVNKVTGIPVETDANLTATSADDCVTTAAVTAPECNCPTVNAPVSDGDQTICADETVADFSVTTDAGLEVDWYDAATGGTLLQANSLVYTPTAAGMYYAEARDPANDCVSAARTVLTLTINASPSLTVDGAACDANLTTYTIDFTSDGTITSDVGTVSGNQVTGIPVGTAANLTATSADDCVTTAVVPSPDCACPTFDLELTGSHICTASDLVLGATTDATISTWEWTGPNDFTSTEQNPTINAADILAAGIYTLIATDENDCTGTATIEIDVQIPQEIQELCENSSLDLEAESGFASYQWYKDGVAIDAANDGDQQVLTVTEAGEYIYTVDGAILDGSCQNQMCCPVVVTIIECDTCPEVKCFSATITKN